jgi:phosphoglycolate phosphatase
MHIDLLIFDLDGTLLDSKQAIVDSINFMLQQLGKEQKTTELICSYIGIGDRNLVMQSVDGDKKVLEEGLLIFRRDYPERIKKHGRLFDGTREMLEHFKNKKKAIVSNGGKSMIEVSLKKHGIKAYFDMLVGGEDENCAKPNPCQIEKVLKALRVAPSRAIMVGDLVLDIQAGKNAGIKTCGTTYGIGLKEDLISARPDFMIDDVSELINLIN